MSLRNWHSLFYISYNLRTHYILTFYQFSLRMT